jgi:drug/metabolite transporter (DMT)-like permease
VQLLQPFVVFALAAVFNDETITPQIVLFAAGVVATVAISTRTRGRKAPDRPQPTSALAVTPPAPPTSEASAAS